MWLVYNLFVYGLKGIWLPWLWPTFNQVFLMVYLSVWVRRSNVLTGGEWITTPLRRGPGRRALPHHRRDLRPGERGRLHRLRLPGHGQVLRRPSCPGTSRPTPTRVIVMAITAVYVLTGGMISVVHHRRGPVRHHGRLLGHHRRHRHGEGVARAARGARPRRLGRPLLRLAARPGLAAPDRRRSRTTWRRTATRFFGIFFIAMLFKGILVTIAGPAPELRHAAHPGRADPARGGADERVSSRRASSPAGS